MEPTFTILLTTYRRPTECLRALSSIKEQTYPTWQTIVVIDDKETDYRAVKQSVQDDARFTLLENEANVGKNASVNRAIELLRKKSYSGYLLFLDDDDWLHIDCLKKLSDLIKKYPKEDWLVTNRVHETDGIPFTKNLTRKKWVTYLTDCLILRRFSGDATHCLNFKTVRSVNFPTTVKNAEEWLYFAHVATCIPQFLYNDVPGTISQGYSTDGLTDRYHANKEHDQNITHLMKEAWGRRLLHPLIWLYLGQRYLRSLTRLPRKNN